MSKEEKFNLQIPIAKTFEDELRELADEDGRPLRTYCRRILELHVKQIKVNKEIVVPTISHPEITTEEVTQETEKKPKVGGFRK